MGNAPIEDVKELIPDVGYRAKPSQTLQSILEAHGLYYRRLTDVPVKVAREIQRRAVFADFRSIEMAGERIHHSLTQLVLKDLLVTRIGYCSRAAGHFIPRPEGALAHVLHYCVDGQGWCEIGGRQWNVMPQTALLIPAGVPHCYGAAEKTPWSIYWIHFTGRMASDFSQLLGATPTSPLFHLPYTEDLVAAFEETYQLMNNVHAYSQLVGASGALARFLSMTNLQRHSVNARLQTAEKNLVKTTYFMRENLSGHYSLRQFAQIAHMSSHYYCSLFRKRYGFSPIEYFNRLKMQKARELLSGTTMQVREVARRLGFNDPYYFSRLFRKTIGVSPSEVRRATGCQDAGSQPGPPPENEELGSANKHV